MSSEFAIKVENLGKFYQIYKKPGDRLLQMLARGRKQYFSEFWALRDVSFEIEPGETLGIVGRNGSGKSTLLQLICGTLNPSTGSLLTKGRIAALLELGAGFNPEFTGRENVYLAAALYGIGRSAVDDRFDRIAAFADIGEHLDQPVKTYSSGMFVRLAFAVIAHVDADILVVDEALAVGDAVFTQRCMRFIRAFQQQGTLLFVSHDMSAVSNLCRQAIWLDHGEVKLVGKAKAVSHAYLQQTLQSVYGDETELRTIARTTAQSADEDIVPDASPDHDRKGPILDYSAKYTIENNLSDALGFESGRAEVLSVEISNLSAKGERVFEGGELVVITVRARAYQALDRPILGFVFNDRLGQALFGENTLAFTDLTSVPVAAGETFAADFTFRLPMLPNGDYVVLASVAQGELHNNIQHHLLHDALVVRVSSSKVRWGLVGVPFEDVVMKVCE
ncbi:ABC transporter ATP-binding protein [Rhizobium sp. RHZ01]|uniref:ABC transporter ATP-binding protein n=1 Tax=Rhizobium sp. RHZ01 TaxID=2769304 RepID=UPI00178215E6|nr:ABC transporter ATP-binding protein [Rhizobium sp. RHZ01]MBD9443981.1 ABC transporter ATP-binding protein [Rhizobium sp. RHZ01]